MCPAGFYFTAVHVEDIIFHMFQYIQKLRTEGPQEWVFDECKVIIFNVKRGSNSMLLVGEESHMYIKNRKIKCQIVNLNLHIYSNSAHNSVFLLMS